MLLEGEPLECDTDLFGGRCLGDAEEFVQLLVVHISTATAEESSLDQDACQTRVDDEEQQRLADSRRLEQIWFTKFIHHSLNRASEHQNNSLDALNERTYDRDAE